MRIQVARLTLWFFLCASMASAQQLTAHRVTDKIYMLEGRGGNIGVLLGEDGVLIVDDQFANVAEDIRTAIAALGVQTPDPQFVLNTHHHGDHTGGNEIFGEKARIVAHENVHNRLLAETKKPGLPVITFGESLTVHFNGETIRMLHVPHGHTDGDSVIFFEESNVVHMGDQFFSGKYPYIDLGSGGDVQGYVVNVAHILGKLPDSVKIIPGHGPLSTKQDLEVFHAMLIEVTDLVKHAISEGKSLEDVKAAGLPDKYADWGTGFMSEERFTEILYNGLSR